MDFDPCAASRIEIVSKTSDLTAFELAGGTLGEPTTVSTVSSHSPEHARTIVKNEAIKQMLAEVTHRIRCDICDVVCYGKETIKRHNEGNKHLENVQKLSAAMKEKIPPPVARAKLHEECEKNVQDLLVNGPSVNSLFVCDIPDLASLHNQNIVAKHLEGEKAGGTLNKPTTIVSTASAPSANSRVDAPQTVKDVVVTKMENENVNFIICDVCNVPCNSQRVFKIHKKGKKHLKNTQKASLAKDTKQDLLPKKGTVNPLLVCDIPDLATYLNQNKVTGMPLFDGTLKAREELNVRQPTWCEVCKVTYCCHKCLDKHISGKQHLKNLENSEKKHVPTINQHIVTMDTIPIESNTIPMDTIPPC